MMNRIVFLLAALLLSAGVSAEIPRNAIPFDFNRHLYLQAHLQDSIPVSLIYDTGADCTYLDKDFLRLSGLDKSFTNRGKFALSGAGDNGFVECPVIFDPVTLSIGETKHTDDFTPILNLREIIGRHADGMVGTNSFFHQPLIVNFSDNYLLSTRELTQDCLKGYAEIPSQFGNLIAIEAELKVDSSQTIKGMFFLDTGYGGSLILTTKSQESLDLTHKNSARVQTSDGGAGGDLSTKVFRADSFRLLDELDDVVVHASYNEKGVLGKNDYAGIIGNDIICHYDWIIDAPNHKIYARRNAVGDKNYQTASRIQMTYVDRTDICDGWVVKSIYENGIARQAGFEIGDIILTINGRPVKEFSREEQFGNLDLRGETVFEVKKRDGTIATYTLNIDKEII